MISNFSNQQKERGGKLRSFFVCCCTAMSLLSNRRLPNHGLLAPGLVP